MLRISLFSSIFAVANIGCSGNENSNAGSTPPPSGESVTEKPIAKKEFKLDAEALRKAAEEVALVPSPAEMQKSLSNAGLSSKLSDLVRSDRNISMDVSDKDNLAVRTGVVLADLVLTVESASKEQKTARFAKLKNGFKVLGGGSDIQNTIDELTKSINNDDDTDLLQEMDELSGVMVPELEYEAGDWVVPLIQAGSWLEGANLVSGAIIKEGKYDVASQLLRQPRVVEYFLKYVQREGGNKAPDKTVQKLEEVLTQLKVIASKSALSEEDVKQINKLTADVLTML